MPIAPTGSPRALQACTMDAVRIDGEDARTQPRRRERERMNSFKAGSTIKGWFVCLLRIRRRNNEKFPPSYFNTRIDDKALQHYPRVNALSRNDRMAARR